MTSTPAPEGLARRQAQPAPPYDRAQWERAVMSSPLHRNTRIVAFVLAHHADELGVVCAGGVQAPTRLEHLARITPKQARLALQQLENWHFFVRPDIRDWPPGSPVRPLALTLPPLAARAEPPHTGEVPK
ncbi:hypothetical protein [Streptomyces sp. NPDC096013]|uniref:hypothetical protein n=1 Tax=Streptomyces sp. NPDC096013 TaxID=3366069 RepID=UPI0038238A50